MLNKKKKIEIDGKKVKVEESVYNLLSGMNQTIHNHEVMMLTWVHKHYIGNAENIVKTEPQRNLFNYAMQIPNASETLKLMLQYDEKEKENQE
tara:strand:- start:127 stop:405 length:279 start_codon:yes stop_codon:yes gene_type:complete